MAVLNGSLGLQGFLGASGERKCSCRVLGFLAVCKGVRMLLCFGVPRFQDFKLYGVG